MGIHERIAESHPKLQRGFVWCKKCNRTQQVDSAECLRSGWPMCCGETMTIDSPKDRGQTVEQCLRGEYR